MAQVKYIQKMSMNDFSINKVIGEGAYGRAILCTSKNDHNLVVIKEIALANLSKQEQKEAWKETKVLSLLHHPNIISYKGSFMEKNKLHIIMDYADGGDLFEQIQNAKNVQFKEDKILEWFVQICLALKHIHDRKILHRDIKCQNIFLMKNGMIKMGDFGIAKVLDHTAQLSKTAIGTPYYLSPEICQGKAYNMKSDVWSLGCVLYELCTLQHAFDAKNMNGLIMKILRSKQNPIPYSYSQNLRTLVDNLLQKVPSKRPSINQILKLDFIRAKIGKFLSATIQKIEFSHTVFHGVKGGETPANVNPDKEIPSIPEGNNIPKQPEIQNVKDPAPKEIKKDNPKELRQADVIAKPKSKLQPKPQQKIAKAPPKRAVNAARAPPAPQVNVKAKPFKPKAPREIQKPPSKDDILANKNAAVVAERKMQKEARDKRENEKREAEEKASQKRAEIMEKKAQREAERAKQMKLLQQEAKDRQKKYENLEAPFKKAMGGAVNSTNQQQPKVKSTEKNERPLPKYRNDYADDLDDDYVDQQKTDNKSNKEKPKLPDKQPTIRPDKVRNREEEQKNLREMMAKKRAELRAQKLAEKKDRQVLEEAMLGQNNGNQNSHNQQNPQDVPTSKEVEPNLSIKKQDILVKDQSNSVCVENVNSSSEEQVEICGVMKRPTRLEDLIHISDSDNEDEDDDILSLVAIVKNILDDPPTSDEDSSEKSDDNDDNSEPSSVIFTFSGKELHLPMVKDNDSLQYRIEALRQFIEKNLGFDKFLEIYRLISVEIDEMNEGEGEAKVKEILNDNELSFYPLIQQLVFCEESI